MHPGLSLSSVSPPVPLQMPGPQAPCPGRVAMEAADGLDAAALEQEVLAAVAADEQRARENEAKLRALRQGVSYEEFRSAGEQPARGRSAAQHTKGCVGTEALPPWLSSEALPLGAQIFSPLKQGHLVGFEL